MNKLILLPGILTLMIVFFIVGLFLIKWMWGWMVVDLFPGAVKEGLIAQSISWFTAFKLAFFVAIMGGITGIKKK